MIDTHDIVTKEAAKEIGWSLLRSAYMNCWGACTQIARAELNTADGGIDAYNEALKEKAAEKDNEDFLFAAGLDSQKPAIVRAREWMGVVSTLYPLMKVSDRQHPAEFVKERLEEKPAFDINAADLAFKARVSGRSAEEILAETRKNQQTMWDKNSALRDATAVVFKSIEPVTHAPDALVEKMHQFLDKQAKKAAVDPWNDRGNDSLVNIENIRNNVGEIEEISIH